MTIRDLTNQRFGRLIALRRLEDDWLCRCDCGVEKLINSYHLTSGAIKSCGCYRRELAYIKSKLNTGRKHTPETRHKMSISQRGKKRSEETKQRISRAKKKHGLAGTFEYGVWHNMLGRCLIQTNPSYSHYGGRGIVVCGRWVHGQDNKSGLQCFIDDMGPCPPGLTLDRRDNDGNYEPSNCRWATRSEQNRNRRARKQ